MDPKLLARLAIHNYLTKTSQAYGEREHELGVMIEKVGTPARVTPGDYLALVRMMRKNTLQMISTNNMLAQYIETLSGPDYEN